MNDTSDFWNRRARDAALDDSQVTHSDVWQRWLEIEVIKRQLRPGDRVIDIGCGAGYATKIVAPLVREIVGIDRSPAMIGRARDSGGLPRNAHFAVEDVSTLSSQSFGTFDLALSVRCLINLPSWAAQQAALDRIADVLRSGGRLLLIEGCQEGRARLNRLREGVGLAPMPPVEYNVDLNESALLEHLGGTFEVLEQRGLGLYDVISRVAHPLLAAPAAPRYDSAINEVAARIALERDGERDVSRVIVLLLRKRG